MLYFGIFGLQFEKAIVIFEINALKFVWLQSLVQNKNPKVWDEKCLILEFLGWNLKKLLPYLKSAPSNFFWLKILRKKKISKFETKNVWFGYFWTGIWKKYYHIWNQHPRICLIAKYCEIMKMPKFRTKNALFGYLWTKTLENYCHIWNQHLRICLIGKFCEETKMPKFGTKNAIFGYFWPRMPYLGIFWQEF